MRIASLTYLSMFQELRASQDLQDQEVNLVQMDQQAHLAHLDQLVLRVRGDHLAVPDNVENVDQEVNQEPRAPQEVLDREEREEKLDQLGKLDLLVRRDQQGQVENQEARENVDHVESQVLQDHRAPQEEMVGHMVLRVLRSDN